MKNILLSVMLFAFVANMSAQIKVDATGRVGIGTANPQYKLDITGDMRVVGSIYLESDTNLIAAANDVPITFKVNGVLAGNTGSSGKLNVSFGYKALSATATTMTSANTAIGHGALQSNIGAVNTAIGHLALYSNTMGGANTAIGLGALLSNKTGGANVAVGIYSGVAADSLTNTIAIGWSARATSSNQARIGNSDITSIGGYAGWTTFSDGRANRNTGTDVPGLAFINRLQPVTYNLNLDAIDGLLHIDKTKIPGEEWLPELVEINRKAKEAKEKVVQTGFIAQDVEAIAKSIGYDFSGVDVDETGIYGLRYAEFVVPLVKAVQELSAQNERLQAQINELTKLVKEGK